MSTRVHFAEVERLLNSFSPREIAMKLVTVSHYLGAACKAQSEQLIALRQRVADLETENAICARSSNE